MNFDNIPNNIRTPGFFIEFNNALAAIASQEFVLLVIGQQLSTATVAAGTINTVTRTSQGETYYGRGAMLAEMLRVIFKTLSVGVTVKAIGLADAGAGVKAAGSVEFTATAAATGTLIFTIAGTDVPVLVTSGDTDEELATALVAAIDADTTLPVAAEVDGMDAALVNLECLWKGETGNTIAISSRFVQGGNTATAPAHTITQLSGGTTNPDVTTAITAMGDEWFNWFVFPYTDDANLDLFEAELLRRWGPIPQIDARAFSAHRANLANTSTFGNSRNSHLVTCMGTNLAPQPPYLWAAVDAAECAKSLAIDPALPLQRLPLTGILPPAIEDRWTLEERNTLLFDGISTYTVDRDGTVRIERQITMYQTNEASQPDASYLDIETPETLSRIRFEQRARIASRFPRHKLTEDGTQFGAGQKVATPSLIRSELLSLYRELENRGWVEDYDGYAATLIVEIGDGQGGGDRNRVNVLDHPNLVNQLRVYAQQSQFIV